MVSFPKQPRDFRRPAALEHIVERIEPLAGLDRIEIGGVFEGM
jgi:hypothetical protein